MAQLKGTVVSSPIVPYDSNDTFATHIDTYGKGGYRAVQTIAERDGIPEARRSEGMLVYVINDPNNINSYQYINSTWTKSKISAGVEKVDTLSDRDAFPSEIGDIVYVKNSSSLFIKLSDNFWCPMSYGVPILTKSQEIAIRESGELPDDFISIPDQEELEIQTETTEYESEGRGYYLDIIFSTLRSLQAEVARLRNSFKYGINSYTGKETAMSSVVGNYTLPEEEPLWAVDEADLSIAAGVIVDLNDNNSLSPSENVTIGNDHLIIRGTSSWTDPSTGFNEITDPKLFLYLTTSSTDVDLTLSKISTPGETITVSLSSLGLRQYENGKYNIMFCLSRTIVDSGNTYGDNYLWISVGNYTTGGTSNKGYWNPNTNKLQSGIVRLDDRYSIKSVSFTDLSLYKFSGYSKYQDLSSTVDPVTPSDDNYKYRVAHITIRSVADEDELMAIKDQLPANELIYNEKTSVLWIKTASGSVKPISGSGGSSDDETTGMEKSEIIEWLAQNGIIVTSDGLENIKINNIADITFIHQDTGKQFRFSVNSEGSLVSEEIPETTLEERMAKAEFEIAEGADVTTNIRGFVGSLGYKEQEKNPQHVIDTKDIGLYSDRVKIGAIYSPPANTNSYGCSHAYIELENTSNRDFQLDGCYLHYATGVSTSQAGGIDDITVYHLKLHGVIPAWGTFLVRGKKYSDFDQANTFIKVKTFDQEWYVENNEGKIELIDLTQNQNNTYLLTYGLPNVSYSTVLISVNSGNTSYSKDNFPKFYHPNYIDSVSIGAPVKASGGFSWSANGQKCFSNSYGDVIFKNTFELDPAKQAYQSANKVDSSRHRNENDQDYQYVFLNKEVIEFPKTAEVFPVDKYTPKASWEHKNVCTDKTKLDLNRPNMVSVSFGIDMHKTRCFNWISAGYFNEYVWIRRKGQTDWEARFESYKGSNEDDAPMESGMTKKTFGEFYNKTTNDEHAPVQSIIYNRLTGTFPADGTKYTSHKCIVDIVSTAALTGKTEYEYIVGRADKNMNPDENHTSRIQTFTLYSKEYTPRVFQTTDQQGFHWIEYQCWAAAAEELNKTIIETCYNFNDEIDSYNQEAEEYNTTYAEEISAGTKQRMELRAGKIFPVLMNTGDMTQNGTRINEWFDYYNAGYCLFDHLEQANVVGNNDLCNTDPEELGTGDDNGKSNGYYFHVFYCYEIDPNVALPIISNPRATKYVPSLYYFQDDNYRFVMLNTEITAINCKKWFEQVTTNTLGDEATVNIYTGWSMKNGKDESNDSVVYDGSFTTVYTMIYNILNSSGNRNTIVACHEMPFTVVTNNNLLVSKGGQGIDRSLKEATTGSLVGCHCNRMGNLDVKSIYWLSRLLEHFNIKLCIGGHKHTYACTNPLREFYFYEDNGEPKNSKDNGKMTMSSTLENDTATWIVKIASTSGNENNFLLENGGSDGDLTFDTTKFPLMSSSSSGITKNDSVYYPFYGVPSLTDGVVYFMCQATGYKLKSNKELPSPDQKFSYVIPETTFPEGKGDTPSPNQQHPMFSEIELNGNSYKIYLYRIQNIMDGKELFSQIKYSTSPAEYRWLKGNEPQGAKPAIFGNWSYTTKTALIEI